jgi:hypothetical protein
VEGPKGISRCGEKSMEVVAALPVKTDAHSQSTWFFFTHIATAVCRRNEETTLPLSPHTRAHGQISAGHVHVEEKCQREANMARHANTAWLNLSVIATQINLGRINHLGVHCKYLWMLVRQRASIHVVLAACSAVHCEEGSAGRGCPRI